MSSVMSDVVVMGMDGVFLKYEATKIAVGRCSQKRLSCQWMFAEE